MLLLSHFSRVRLCNPIDSSPPGSPIPEILQARVLEWVAIPFSSKPCAAAAAAAKSLQSCQTLCSPIDGSPPSSPIPEILQARVLEWVAIPFSIKPCNAAAAAAAKSLQSCQTLCNPLDGSPPSSPIPGILQARVLECIAIPFSIKPCAAAAAKSLQSCPTLCSPIDGSPPGSPVPGILLHNRCSINTC